MEQLKIGKFISYCRKAKGFTQSQLAEKLGITDKAVSKWENGKSMPDLSLLMPLCELLGITLNELLLGEYISEENLKEKSNQLLFDVITGWIGKDEDMMFKVKKKEKPLLKLMNITKVYQNEAASVCAVNDVSFTVSQGSIVGIMGASGSGKTTLLNIIAAIDRPTTGTAEINGQNILSISDKDLAKFRRENLGFIFQEYNLLDTLTVYENIALALTIKEVPKEKISKVIKKISEELNISNVLEKYPYEISGGQRQRCACARAVAVNPSLILADEPTGALDTHAAKQLLDTLCFLRKEYNATILIVTHDTISASYCDRILFLQDGSITFDLRKEQETRQKFFAKILDTIAKMEGEQYHVF